MNTQLAFIFPGQGSQTVGMLSDLALTYPIVKQTFATASEAAGYDLWQLAAHGPEAELNLTHNTQVAMLAAGVAVWRVWQTRSSLVPAFMAGHSLGEYTALVCAGALDFVDAVRLVALRGRYMQEAVPADAGAMAALLGLDDEQVVEICRLAADDEIVAAANFNSPGQVVISGHAPAVARAVARAKAAGAKRAVMLPVSVPSHCALMQPAALRFAEHLNKTNFKTPAIAVLNNVDVAICVKPEALRDALVRQLYSPVRWSSIIRALADKGVTTLLECGPGKVLSGLNKRIDARLESYTLGSNLGLGQALDKLGNNHANKELQYAAER